jgi:hypothetical protein
MRLLEFFNEFIDIFRSRYVRYLEAEVVRLRMETAALNHTLLASKGIQQIPSPDLQDLSARGKGLRSVGKQEPRAPGEMRPVVGSGTHAKLRAQLERASHKEAAEMEAEIRNHRAKQEEIKTHAAQ